MKKKTRSVLKSQKLSRGKKKKRRRIKIVLTLSCLAILVATSAFFVKQHLVTPNPNSNETIKKEVLTHFRFHAGVKNKDVLIKKINKKTQQIVAKHNKFDLEQIATDLKKEFGFERLHIISTKPYSIIISVKSRIPALSIKHKDKHLLVSELGTVYSDKQGKSKQLPLIKGVLTSKKLVKNNDGTWRTTEDEKNTLKNALKILKIAKNQNLGVKMLEFEKYRGLILTLKKGSCAIYLGEDNYAKKFRRLAKILESLKNKSSTCERIELDYSSKAFIKVKI